MATSVEEWRVLATVDGKWRITYCEGPDWVCDVTGFRLDVELWTHLPEAPQLPEVTG